MPRSFLVKKHQSSKKPKYERLTSQTEGKTRMARFIRHKVTGWAESNKVVEVQS